jgi:hypothetical protein
VLVQVVRESHALGLRHSSTSTQPSMPVPVYPAGQRRTRTSRGLRSCRGSRGAGRALKGGPQLRHSSTSTQPSMPVPV